MSEVPRNRESFISGKLCQVGLFFFRLVINCVNLSVSGPGVK